MPQVAQQVDLTSLVQALQALTQTLGLNAKNITAALNTGFDPANWYHISGAGTFVASTNPGTVFSININSGEIGATGTLYDAAAITAIAGSLEIGVFSFGTEVPDNLPVGPPNRGLSLNNGLVVITTGSPDITIGVL